MTQPRKEVIRRQKVIDKVPPRKEKIDKTLRTSLLRAFLAERRVTTATRRLRNAKLEPRKEKTKKLQVDNLVQVSKLISALIAQISVFWRDKQFCKNNRFSITYSD